MQEKIDTAELDERLDVYIAEANKALKDPLAETALAQAYRNAIDARLALPLDQQNNLSNWKVAIIAALESGGYEQTCFELFGKTHKTCCAEGIIANLAIKVGRAKKVKIGSRPAVYINGNSFERTFPFGRLCLFLPFYENKNGSHSYGLIDLNDRAKFSFKQIARLLKENLFKYNGVLF